MATAFLAIGGCGTQVAGRLLQQHARILEDNHISVTLVDCCVNTLSAYRVVFGEDMLGARQLYLKNTVTRGLGSGRRRSWALEIYEENKEKLSALLDGVERVILVGGPGGGMGSVVLTKLAQEAAERGLEVNVYAAGIEPWERDNHRDNCRWVQEELQRYPIKFELIDPEPFLEEYKENRDPSKWSVVDFRKCYTEQKIIERILAGIQ